MKFTRLKDRERDDYIYAVYKKTTQQNSDYPPFPFGIDRAGFKDKRVVLQCQGGGFYQGPTISALIAKILVAQETVDGEAKEKLNS
jgi:acetyl esterase/lipase